MSYKDKEKQREYERQWEKNNKEKRAELKRQWEEEHPWSRHYKNAKQRCEYPNTPSYKRYGGRGIRMFLTPQDVEFLYKRDNAQDMDKPSIDRIDSDDHYWFWNCRFIEQSENSRRQGKATLNQNTEVSDVRFE